MHPSRHFFFLIRKEFTKRSLSLFYNFVFSFFLACGGHLIATEQTKYLYSHAKYGNHNYDHKTDCDWAIEAPLGKNVHLAFISFNLEDEPDCNYDFVEVYSGLDLSSPTFGRFCGNSVSS